MEKIAAHHSVQESVESRSFLFKAVHRSLRNPPARPIVANTNIKNAKEEPVTIRTITIM